MRSASYLFSVVLTALALAFAAPALAQDAAATVTAPELEWQSVITGQIEAFRHNDAPAAFSFAASGFQENFPSARIFFDAIMASGYEPIMTSTSHNFGKFRFDAASDDVVQQVMFVGPHQELFEAIYNLAREANGWRVVGVMLGTPTGIGV